MDDLLPILKSLFTSFTSKQHPLNVLYSSQTMLKVELAIKMPAKIRTIRLERKAYSFIHISRYGANFSLKNIHFLFNRHLFFRIQNCLSCRMVRKLSSHVVDHVLKLPLAVYSLLNNFLSRCSIVTDNRFIMQFLKDGVLPLPISCCHGTCQDGKQKQDGYHKTCHFSRYERCRGCRLP